MLPFSLFELKCKVMGFARLDIVLDMYILQYATLRWSRFPLEAEGTLVYDL